MYTQFFGNFLLSRNAVTSEQLIAALKQKASQHLKLGTLAIHSGYMSASEVDQVVILQTHQDRRFGEIAIEEGFLTEEQLKELLHSQSLDYLILGQIFVDEGIISNAQLEALINEYESENEIYELDYHEEQKEVVDRLLEKFLYIAERPVTEYDYSYTTLLFNNLIRFIGEDFSPVCPMPCSEYPRNVCISQKVSGRFGLNIYIDMPETTCLGFASRYIGEEITVFDEYVQASIEDFVNLHNGLFNVNISNSKGIELTLAPPIRITEELLSLSDNSYLMPVIYPFGTINFIFEFISFPKE